MTGFSLGPTSLTKVGETIGLGCQNCALLELCGGTFSEFDCLAKCCNNPTSCTAACPRSDNFVEVLQDAGGLDAMQSWNIAQAASQLPVYIPLVHNGSARSRAMTSSYVAFTTFDVVSPEAKRVFSNPSDLREHFQVCADAQVLLLSIVRTFVWNSIGGGVRPVNSPGIWPLSAWRISRRLIFRFRLTYRDQSIW